MLSLLKEYWTVDIQEKQSIIEILKNSSIHQYYTERVAS